ncbi:hypothetical protein BO82DRAFT_100814 [Aspergillus uvarum CBS 121591]|uniref:Uncharacterized protein n=1 Tax=Aspergillus uvarum CBS 121591 TaxID=1448315 RepID=A0A319DNH3_9EURO|nr:hypothetical protein BO82DRAFT_100814 [Aspergillus uvarum CBS 121591]PYH80892.1 hypothetical protein BO82DRAFT_100814 [Aspergillus uvarum CBS 121591]
MGFITIPPFAFSPLLSSGPDALFTLSAPRPPYTRIPVPLASSHLIFLSLSLLPLLPPFLPLVTLSTKNIPSYYRTNFLAMGLANLPFPFAL